MFPPAFKNLIEHPLFFKGAAVFVFILLTLLIVRFIQSFIAGKINDKDLRYKIRKGVTLAGYVVIVFATLSIFSDQMTHLAVIIGALSVGIGFALRELIQGLIGWSVVILGGLFKPGDRIKIGGVMGDVIDIGPLTTTVMECGVWVNSDLYNGRVVYISNSLILREHVYNYSLEFPYVWDEIVIPVRADSDHRLARQIIEQAGQMVQQKVQQAAQHAWKKFTLHHRVEEETMDPVVTMSVDANWIEFTLRYMAHNHQRRTSKDRLFFKILQGFEDTNGRVQLASNKLHLSEVPELSVRLHAPES